MKVISKLSCAVALTGALAAGSVNAGVSAVSDQAAFSVLGTIAQNVNFDSYAYPGWSFPGSPFVVGDLTFIAGGESVIGGGYYGFPRNLLTDDYMLGTAIKVSGAYDLFAFNMGSFAGTNVEALDITTNFGTYQFLEFLPVTPGMQFFGFQTTSAGEYFTSIAIYGSGAAGFTDVQIGVSAVPEPETYAMLLVGLGLLGFSVRRKQNV